MRLDVYLVEQRLFPSREKAKQAIGAGYVLVNQKTCNKGRCNNCSRWCRRSNHT